MAHRRSRHDSGIQTLVASHVPVATERGSDVLGFVSIFAATLAGFGGLGIWAIAACAVALASTSYAEHYALYRRGQELGLTDITRLTTLRSFANCLVAAGGAYVGGWLLRLL